MSGDKLVKFGFYVHETTRDTFIEFVKNKHKMYHGNVSHEGEEALLAWMRTNAQTQIVPIPPNPTYPLTHRVMDQIMLKLKTELMCIGQCTINDLKQAIRLTGRYDERTQMKWVKTLVEERKVKLINLGLFEIV